MGTRAAVKFNGKLMLATHWDGNPSTLGKELAVLKDKSAENVVKVASGHSIDQIAPEFAPKNPIVLKNGAYLGDGKRGDKITYFPRNDAEMTALQKSHGTWMEGGGGTADRTKEVEFKFADVVPMSTYGDFAEWEYDIKGDKVYARPLSDSYDKSDKTGKFTLITPETADQYEKKITEAQHKSYLKKELAEAKSDPKHGVGRIQLTVETSGSREPSGEWTVSSYKDKLTADEKKEVKSFLGIPKVRQLIGKGWHYESLRHKLAAYGIKTTAMKGNMPKMRSIYKMSKR